MPEKRPWDAERVEAIRTALKMTQQELADACGVYIRTAQRWLYKGDEPKRGQKPMASAIKLLEQLEAKACERKRNLKH